jgi:hypothetical protein
MDPFERVAEWRPVSARWFLHRPEPLLHERMWGCSLPLPDEQRRRQPWHEEGGFDAAGRPIAWRQVGHERGGLADPGAREIAVVEDGVTVVRREGMAVARTTYDGRRLPVRTEYPGALGHETYEHDEGYAPKVESIRGHNPPDRGARWEASWPPGAPRGEDEWP